MNNGEKHLTGAQRRERMRLAQEGRQYVSRRERVRVGRRNSDVRRHSGRIPQVWGKFFGTRRRTILTLAIILFVPIVVVQLFYSTTSLLPNVYVGSVNLSYMKKTEAAEKLNKAYAQTKVPIYISDSDEVAVEPTLSNLGFTVKNEARVDAYKYPFLARLVPYSLFWYQLFIGKGEPEATQNKESFNSFVTARFGADCEFEPVNGTIGYVDDGYDKGLQVIDAARGGSCDVNELLQKLRAVSAQLKQPKITLQGTSTAAQISTEVAQKEYNRLMKQLGKGVALRVEDKTETIEKKTVETWVEYSTDGGKLTLGLNSDKGSKWLTDKYGATYTSNAGVTTIDVKDYAEANKTVGKSGQNLNTASTLDEIKKDLAGSQDTAKLVVDSIEPAVQYTRSYSDPDATISNIIKNYAATHAGTYGAKMVELSGSRRNASYNSSHIFTTASTYKLFVAYSILLRIERGELSWNGSSYGSYSVSTCFDRMIMYSDNDCAVWFLLHVSYAGVQADARALGASHTTFDLNNGISSNAEDEAYFLSLVYTKQIGLKDESIARLIAAMKQNVYVAGIPTGIPNATVADKVGFLDGLLHDAAIVYSSKGDYVLIIMTDNASWANIAELAGQIEAAR